MVRRLASTVSLMLAISARMRPRFRRMPSAACVGRCLACGGSAIVAPSYLWDQAGADLLALSAGDACCLPCRRCHHNSLDAVLFLVGVQRPSKVCLGPKVRSPDTMKWPSASTPKLPTCCGATVGHV